MKSLQFTAKPHGQLRDISCSVEELEYEFLRLHERTRKTHDYQASPTFRAMFESNVFLFPDGLMPTDAEFYAHRDHVGPLNLPVSSLWVGSWDVFLSEGLWYDGPIFYHVSPDAIHAAFGKSGKLFPDDRSDRPSLVTGALHRLSNPDATASVLPLSVDADDVNVGRALSKFALRPLGRFVSVTGVCAPEPDDIEDEECEEPTLVEGKHRLATMRDLWKAMFQ